MSNQKIIDAVTIVISPARISTYENATGGKKPDNLEAISPTGSITFRSSSSTK